MSVKRATICLLRNDLRFNDNQVLRWANENSDNILPVYCFDPRHYGKTHHFGFPKTGFHQLKFLLESLLDLKSTLQSRGSDLLVQHGKPEDILPAIVTKIGKDNVKAVVYHEEITQEETDVEKNIKSNCNVNVQTFWGSTLYHKSDLPFPCQQLPDVYTQFRQKVESRCRVRHLMDMPEKLKPPPGGFVFDDIPAVESFNVQVLPPDSRTAFPFQGGETSALSRLNNYLWETNQVATYKRTRNGLIGADFSTKFSPWLAYGCISPRQIYWDTKKYEQEVTANDSTYWVIFELRWRDYFKFVGVKFGNKLFFPYGLRDKKIEWKHNVEAFKAWQDGMTGIPFVDANMRELKATGFMSNRGRQNVASFLTKDLQLDWRLGAEWFESLLIDHDVCSNYGNWLYTAGLGNDPRENRKFNMIKQAMDYDAQGEYVKLWISELSQIDGASVHTPWTIGGALLSRSGVRLGETYPKPIHLAPEWNKHSANKRPASGKPKGQQRGMDFYFKKN